ncbi:hypothetical protein L1887_20145 [Cichorium endivia]|nr:hypothetical protein L1887_20145 [Cichorium endivia]
MVCGGKGFGFERETTALRGRVSNFESVSLKFNLGIKNLSFKFDKQIAYIAILPRLAKAGDVTTESESIVVESNADVVSAVIVRRDCEEEEEGFRKVLFLDFPEIYNRVEQGDLTRISDGLIFFDSVSAVVYPLIFSNFTESQAECLVKRTPVREFHVEKRQSLLVLCWQRRKEEPENKKSISFSSRLRTKL